MINDKDVFRKKFKEEFKADDYLKTYYTKTDPDSIRRYVAKSNVAAETQRIMIFMEMASRTAIKSVFGRKKPLLLELGGGPTLYQLMNIVSDVGEIHFTDLVDDNLKQIRDWKDGSGSQFDWNQFFKIALIIKEDKMDIGEKNILLLENELRNKITRIGYADIFESGLGISDQSYDIISTHFVAECATTSHSMLKSAYQNMFDKLKEGGLLIMSALRGARGGYPSWNKMFPAVEIRENDLEHGLKTVGFELLRMVTANTDDRSNNYDGFMFVIARKRNQGRRDI